MTSRKVTEGVTPLGKWPAIPATCGGTPTGPASFLAAALAAMDDAVPRNSAATPSMPAWPDSTPSTTTWPTGPGPGMPSQASRASERPNEATGAVARAEPLRPGWPPARTYRPERTATRPGGRRAAIRVPVRQGEPPPPRHPAICRDLTPRPSGPADFAPVLPGWTPPHPPPAPDVGEAAGMKRSARRACLTPSRRGTRAGDAAIAGSGSHPRRRPRCPVATPVGAVAAGATGGGWR